MELEKVWNNFSEDVKELNYIKELFVAMVIASGGKMVVDNRDIFDAREGVKVVSIDRRKEKKVILEVAGYKNRLCVIYAGNAEQAAIYAKDNKLKPGGFKVVFTVEHLRGLDRNDCYFVLVGTWWKNPGYPEFSKMAQRLGYVFIQD